MLVVKCGLQLDDAMQFEAKAAEEPDKLRLSSDLSHMKTGGGKDFCRGLYAMWKELIFMAGYRCGLPSHPACAK